MAHVSWSWTKWAQAVNETFQASLKAPFYKQDITMPKKAARKLDPVLLLDIRRED